MLNPTMIFICLFILIFSFSYIIYLNAHLMTKYCDVNMYYNVEDVLLGWNEPEVNPDLVGTS